MVINMDEAKLRSIAQLQEFLDATQEISFTVAPGDSDQQRYEHISRVRKRFAYRTLVKRYTGPAVPFACKYTGADVELLVEMDRANEDVCGVAIVHLLRRAFIEYADPRYERLSKL